MTSPVGCTHGGTFQPCIAIFAALMSLSGPPAASERAPPPQAWLSACQALAMRAFFRRPVEEEGRQVPDREDQRRVHSNLPNAVPKKQAYHCVTQHQQTKRLAWISDSFNVAQCGGSGLRNWNSQARGPQKALLRGPHVASDKPGTTCMRHGMVDKGLSIVFVCTVPERQKDTSSPTPP